MTATDVAQRNGKSNLRVLRTQEGQFYVESAEGKICYRVIASNGTKSCSCGDYTSRIEKDPTFLCKHILAVINGNGNIRDVETQVEKPKLDERWILEIEGREFVKYPGLLDLGHQKGIMKIDVEPLQMPTKENGMFAICKALVVSPDGRMFTDVGDANPENCSSKVKKHVLRMASTRAIARALRSYTNIGMTAVEELGDTDDDDAIRGRRTRSAAERKPTPTGAAPNEKTQEAKKEIGKGPDAGPLPRGAQSPTQEKAQTLSDTQKGQVKPSEAQIKAIEKLAERRGINGEQLVKIFTDKFGKPYLEISSDEAKDFIKHLQQAA